MTANKINKLKPSKNLKKALKEIEDYKKGKIKLPNFTNTKDLFIYLDK